MSWNGEQTEACVKLWNQGLSASAVGIRIGKSRNAVIGKVHRLAHDRNTCHLIQRQPVARSSGPPLTCDLKRLRKARELKHGGAMRWGKTHSLAPVEPAPLPPEPPTPETLVSFADLEQGMCKFPFGDPKREGFGFCGCKTVANAVYCPGHQALCTGQTPVYKPTSGCEVKRPARRIGRTTGVLMV